MESVAASWGKRIAKRRAELQYSQRRLGELCGGVAQPTISKIERGDLVPGDELKWKLAGALQLPLDELFAYPAIIPPFPAVA
ncbi:MAG TPA: helix-turn-helix transcriptional regulator [Acidimicrobiales bacterium]|nr:helix-turn-helix transcriptional regulator [Acidimicrobiales bacterium]